MGGDAMILIHDTIVALGFAGAFLFTGAGIGFYVRGILARSK